MEDKKNKSSEVSWLTKIVKRYQDTGNLIPVLQEETYKKIRDHFTHGRIVMDVGCSIGVGSNILSHEARSVWGVDVNDEALGFAVKYLKRPNLDFAYLDIEKLPTRELSKFEIIVMIEVIEHLADPEQALNVLKTFFGPNTVAFISVPNILNPETKERDDKNELHLSHWTAGEFYELMTKHFSNVVLYSASKLSTWDISETVDGSSTDPLIIAKVEGPKL